MSSVRYFIIPFVACLLSAPSATLARVSIAVVPFSTPDSFAGTDAGRWLAELAQRELLQSHSVDVIEISEVRRLTRGKDVELSGFLAGDDIRPVFNSVDADFLLTGRVVRFGSDARLDPLGQFWAATWGDELYSGTSAVEIDIRLLDRRSGKPVSFFTVSKVYSGRKDILTNSAIRDALRLSRTHQEDFRRSRIFQASSDCANQIAAHLARYFDKPLTISEILPDGEDTYVLVGLQLLEETAIGQRYVATPTFTTPDAIDLSAPTVIEIVSQDLLTAKGKVIAGNTPGRGDSLIAAEMLPDTVVQPDN